ncbi:MAG TPA: M20/M25/M40 family metallo-hydrolase [Opitutaceae bacterium]|nr:M20/M25/M40 family metallo-hydrolase [Opitutaceae bacterium]
MARAAEPAPFPPDPEIQKMVASIDGSRVQRSLLVLASSSTRHTLSDPLPSGDGIGGAGAWIRAELGRIAAATGGRLQVREDDFTAKAKPPQLPRSAALVNYVATLPGSRPEAARRVYVLSAHYDSRGRNPADPQAPAPGADDDASGVAAVMAAARALAPRQFGATVVFLLTSGGEQGNLGADHWAEQARQRGLEIAGVIDDDRVGNSRDAAGGNDRAHVRLFAPGEDPDSSSRSLARAIRDAAARYVPALAVNVLFRSDRYGDDGGHRPFLERGWPAVRLTEAADDPRGHDDTPDFIDFAYVTAVAQANAAALAALARAPAPPAQAWVRVGRRWPPATVVWTGSADPAVAGYRVLWRETTAPFWQHALNAARGSNEADVAGVAPDDAVFGVQSFDAAGHAGPAVVALPRR